MKYTLAFFLILFSASSFSQENLYKLDPDFVRSNGIRKAENRWVFYKNGNESSSKTLLTFYFNENGQKEYGIASTPSSGANIDSLVYTYDAQNREISRIDYVEINPKQRKIKDPALRKEIGTRKEWRTTYTANTIIKVNPKGDTLTILLNEEGQPLSEGRPSEKVLYEYSNKGKLVKKTEIPFTMVVGQFSVPYYRPYDTIVTTYNALEKPIQTTGVSVSKEYTYEEGRLVTEITIDKEWNDTTTENFTYTNEGKIASMERLVYGRVMYLEKYKYDESGILIKVISIDPETNETSLIVEYIYSE